MKSKKNKYKNISRKSYGPTKIKKRLRNKKKTRKTHKNKKKLAGCWPFNNCSRYNNSQDEHISSPLNSENESNEFLNSIVQQANRAEEQYINAQEILEDTRNRQMWAEIRALETETQLRHRGNTTGRSHESFLQRAYENNRVIANETKKRAEDAREYAIYEIKKAILYENLRNHTLPDHLIIKNPNNLYNIGSKNS